MLIVGPEGGFSDAEAQLARARGAETVSLGARVLRTETVALAALAGGMLGGLIYRWLGSTKES